jgi:hypothetical protein
MLRIHFLSVFEDRLKLVWAPADFGDLESRKRSPLYWKHYQSTHRMPKKLCPNKMLKLNRRHSVYEQHT